MNCTVLHNTRVRNMFIAYRICWEAHLYDSETSFVLFQLAELHVYVIPRESWVTQRNLAKKSVVEDCVSVGFVRSVE